MSCSPFELKDYFFGELDPPERDAVEHHVASCASCREELAGLTTMRAVLLSVPDEEPPRRIAFVSDKVFEPRWWQKLWTSGARLGFASAAMLALAIVLHGFASQEQQMAKTLNLLNARLKDSRMEQREQLLMIQDYLERMEKRNAVRISRANYE
jgi:anti-sigma factor RsiW